MVVPEYDPGAGGNYYALFSGGSKPDVIVEARRFGDQLKNAADRGMEYCMRNGIDYFAVTNGRAWRVYGARGQVPTPKKLIESFDIGSMSPADVCVRMMVLWRRQLGRSARAKPDGAASGRRQAPAKRHASIADVKYKKGDSAPAKVVFPDGSAAALRSWTDLLVRTAAWLVENDHITRDNCPVESGRSQFIVSATPRHRNGRPFMKKLKVRGLYLERHVDPKSVLSRSVRLVKRAGLDPRSFNLAAG